MNKSHKRCESSQLGGRSFKSGEKGKGFLHQELNLEVVDSHAHFLPYSTFQTMIAEQGTATMRKRLRSRSGLREVEVPGPEEDLAARWVAELDRYGVTRIGMMVSPDAWEEFAQAMHRFPGRFYGYALLDPTKRGMEEQAKRAVRELGFHAFKLYPVVHCFHTYGEEAYRVYRLAEELGVPVLHHFGISIGPRVDLRYGNPLDLQPVARDFPDVQLGIAHLGAGMFREALLLMYQTDNIYLDTSGSNIWMRYQPCHLDLEEVLRRALEAAGPERIVFGTDSSVFPRGFRIDVLESQLHAFLKIGVSRQDLEKIFASNIRRLMGES